MAICVDKKKDENDNIVGYYINENSAEKPSYYDAEYLTTLLKTGKMKVENMKYDMLLHKVVFI